MAKIKLFKKKYLQFIIPVLAIIAIIIVYYYFREVEKFSSRRTKLKLNLYDRVSAYYDEDGKWYTATVTKIYDTGNIDIHYDGYTTDDDDINITPWNNVVKKIKKTNRQLMNDMMQSEPSKIESSKPYDPLEDWGNYYGSCEDIKLKDEVLSAKCRTISRSLKESSIKVTDKDKGYILNCDGTLARTCENQQD